MPDAPVRGGHVHYERAGSGPVLVCLHGIGGNARSWRHQLDGLSDAFTVVAWDGRGYGGSTDPPDGWSMDDFADDLAGVLDHLGTRQAHILGVSMGGVIALAFWRRHAARVGSLILSDTYCGGATLPPEERDARLQRRLAAAAAGVPEEAARARAPEILRLQPDPALIEEVASIMIELHPAGYRAAATALAYADETATLPTITAPTLVICGVEDRVLPVPESEKLQRGIAGAELVLIADAGHAPNQEQPAIFNAAVRAFLQRLA